MPLQSGVSEASMAIGHLGSLVRLVLVSRSCLLGAQEMSPFVCEQVSLPADMSACNREGQNPECEGTG